MKQQTETENVLYMSVQEFIYVITDHNLYGFSSALTCTECNSIKVTQRQWLSSNQTKKCVVSPQANLTLVASAY